jgi:hypothetical protein
MSPRSVVDIIEEELNKVMTPQAPTKRPFVRLVTAREAASMMGVPVDFLLAHSSPVVPPQADRADVTWFDLRDIEDWIDRRKAEK